MAVRTLLLLSVVFALAFSQAPSPVHVGPVTKNITLFEPYFLAFGPFNFIDTNATITVTHSVNVVVCVGVSEFGLPNATIYSMSLCRWFFNWTATEKDKATVSMANIPAAMYNYTIGVYFAYAADITDKNRTEITCEVTGESCLGDGVAFYDAEKKMCQNVTKMFTKTGENVTHTFKGREIAFFTFMSPDRSPHFTLKFSTGEADDDAADWEAYVRFNGVADQYHYNYFDEANGTLTVHLPLPGLWVFAVHHKSTDITPVDAMLTFTFKDTCPSGQAGDPCRNIPEAANNVTQLITGEGGSAPTYYYRFMATHEQKLLVSITTYNRTMLPSLYATRGQLPATDGSNADILNCNRDYCDHVHSIGHNVTSGPEEWFITVHTSLTGATANITFGIWFNVSCVPDCTKNNRGQCRPDGTCDCLLDFEGIDCAISDGLGAPYIVLIIIASLVVASAVVGFVAWAYMRRKRDNYETLA